MIRRQATQEQIEFAKSFLDKGSIANRGTFDGNYEKQLIGITAQVVVCDFLKCERPKNQNNFDNGIDLIWKEKHWDVKCEKRTVSFNMDLFVHNLYGSQINYGAEGYIFVSYNSSREVFEICGYISKEEFKQKATYFPDGSKRVRSDGSSFTINGNAGMYELENKHLILFDYGYEEPFKMVAEPEKLEPQPKIEMWGNLRVIIPPERHSYSCQRCQKIIDFETEQKMVPYISPVCKKCKEYLKGKYI